MFQLLVLFTVVNAGFGQVDLENVNKFHNFFPRIIRLRSHAVWEGATEFRTTLVFFPVFFLLMVSPRLPSPPDLPLFMPLTLYSEVLEDAGVSHCSILGWQTMHGGPNSASRLFLGACELRIVFKILNG